MNIILSLSAAISLIGIGGFNYPGSNDSVSPSSARSAAQVYTKYCVECHGKDGQAKTRKAKFNHARNIADPAWQDEVSDERIFNSIMNGRNVLGAMPAFNKKISEDEADSLVTFVRGLKK